MFTARHAGEDCTYFYHRQGSKHGSNPRLGALSVASLKDIHERLTLLNRGARLSAISAVFTFQPTAGRGISCSSMQIPFLPSSLCLSLCLSLLLSYPLSLPLSICLAPFTL